VRLQGGNQYDTIYTIYNESFARIPWTQLSKELERLYEQAQNKLTKDAIIETTNRSATKESEK
jgi:hypothetical protein